MVKVEKDEYKHGYLKIVGTVENVGSASAFSPSVQVRVYRGSTVLAEDTVWPAGMHLRTVGPGTKAAFECISRVPGEPASTSLTYDVGMKESHTVEYPKRK